MIVEDDASTRRLMKKVIESAGYTTVLASDGEDALAQMDTHHVDLIVLDVMMPRMDGYAFVSLLRETNTNTPVLMVTARETMADKRRGFLTGADDYMVKPVDEEELLLRIGALLRRSKIAYERKIAVGGSVLDYDAMTVETGGTRLELPQKEFRLLYKLLSYQNKIFTRRQLMDELWDMDSDTAERTVDVHINRLRDKFRESDDFEIVTVRGLGYKAVPKAKEDAPC